MWQRFTQHARTIVFYAQEEAQKFGEGYVSTEHLLLGITRDGATTAAQVLQKNGVSLKRLRHEVEKHLPRGDARPSQDMTLTPRAKRVIDLAYAEARDMQDNFIGSEHLLLGLIREGDGLAGRVLQQLGVELEETRAVLQNIRGDPPREGVPQPTPESGVRAAPHGRSTTEFLLGACIQEHLMLNLTAGGGKAAEIIRAQVEDVGDLQWQLWQEIVRYARVGAKGAYPDVLPTILEIAHAEAGDKPVAAEHILLALLDPRWDAYRFALILKQAGLTLKVSRELAA